MQIKIFNYLDRNDCLNLQLVCKSFLMLIRKYVLNYKEKKFDVYKLRQFVNIFYNKNIIYFPYKILEIDYCAYINDLENITKSLISIVSENDIHLNLITNFEPSLFSSLFFKTVIRKRFISFLVKITENIYQIEWDLSLCDFYSDSLRDFQRISEDDVKIVLNLSKLIPTYIKLDIFHIIKNQKNIILNILSINLNRFINNYSSKNYEILSKVTHNITKLTCYASKIEHFCFMKSLNPNLTDLKVTIKKMEYRPDEDEGLTDEDYFSLFLDVIDNFKNLKVSSSIANVD